MSQKQLTLAKAWPGLVDRELKFMKTKSFWSLSLLLGLLVSSRMTGGAQTVTQVSAGSNHSLFRLSDGSLWGLGYNGDGELGDGTYNNTNRPEEIVAGGVTAIAAGTYHSLFLESDGSLWGMGDAFYGELGDGASNSTTNRPEKIAPGGVAAIAAGSRFSLFLKSDGSLWAMGDNNQGQLGDGTNSNNNILNTNLPEQTVASNVTAIAAGGGHSLFLKSDGSLWGNGDNSHGQLGDGTYNFTNHPEQIVATNVTAIAAGTFHSLFLKSDGSLWGMGDNAYGQLGDGNITGINAGTNRPELIVSSGVVAIADGTGHSLFLKSDGSLWGMGVNDHGQLGDGTYNNTNRPEEIVASGVVAIAAGWGHSLFAKSDGSLWGMGVNDSGQLGDGAGSQTNRPVKIWPANLVASLPVITSQPQSQTNQAGTTVTLPVAATGTAPLHYQWDFNGGAIAGATNSMLTLSNVAVTNAGRYQVILTNAYGSATSIVAVITVTTNTRVLISGVNMNAAVQGYLTTMGYSSTIVTPSAFGSTSFAGYYAIWLGSESTFTDLKARQADLTNFVAAGGILFCEIAVGYGSPMTNYPFGGKLAIQTGRGDTVRIVNAGSPVNAGLDDAGLSGWNGSDHTEFTGIGSFSGVTDNGTNGYWVTIIRNLGSGYIVYSGQDVSYHIQNGLGPTGAASPKGVLLNNILSLVYTPSAPTVTGISAGYDHSLLLMSDGSMWGWGIGRQGQLGAGYLNGASRPVQIVSNGVTAITAGRYHETLFVKDDGSLWGMGMNAYCQLGNCGSSVQPEQTVASNVMAVAMGIEHSLFIKNDGSLWAMGYGGQGELGDGNYRESPPEQIVASNVTAIAAGGYHSLFLKSDGSLWAMGANGEGQLGDGIYEPSYRTNLPEQIVASGVTAIAAGNTWSLFLKSDGSLWGMGFNLDGTLGDGSDNNTNRPELIVSSGVTAIAAGGDHSLFLKSDGSLWAMGNNHSGQLGDGTPFAGTYGYTNRPERIVAGGVTAISAGNDWSLFIKSDGSLWAMGDNQFAELGDGGSEQSTNVPEQIWPTNTVPVPPVIVTQPVSRNVVLGNNAALSVIASGTSPLAYQWDFNGVPIPGGTGSSLSLSNVTCANAGKYQVIITNAYGSATSSVVSLVVTAITVTNIAAGDYQSLFIKSDGSLWVMGDNYYGELGDGTYNNTNRPEEIMTNGVTAIAGGGYDSFFLKSDGSLWAMGANGYGALGDGTTDGGTYQTNRPEMIIATNVTAIAAGESHTLFVKQDGSLWAMGYNNHGQLGDGTFNASGRPEQILAGGVTAVAAGNGYSLVLQNDGSLWTMGYNHYGQLGDGTTNDFNQPERIVTGGVTAIAAGQYHSLFIKSDGSLWGMGNNNFGQLGDGTTINATQPEQIVASGVTTIAAGFYHSMFAKSDGSLWTMGGNFQGQLGDGSSDGGTLRTNRPEQVVTGGVTMLAAGSGHSLFIKSDGSLWAMGNNAQGALGDGTTDDGTYSTNRPEQIVGTSGPLPVITTQPASQTVAAGSSASFFVTDTACSVNYQWYKGATPIGGATSATLTLLNVQDAAAGSYSVILSNGAGFVTSSNATLTVVDPARITSQPQSQTNRAGTTATFTVTATGTAPGYQWYQGATPIGGATNAALTLLNVQDANAGSYHVVLSNAAGTVTSSDATLTVIDTPMITTQPLSQLILVGNNATFSVTAAGAQPLSYQWNCNGITIPGATNSSLTLTNAGFANAGDYRVVISNAHGSATSSVASLVVIMNNAVKVAAGDYHSLFLKSDGSLWVMGDNYYGELGDGTYNNTNRPEEIVTNGVTAIAGGGYDSFFLKNDGSLWAMGANGYGALGDGTTDGGTYQTNRPEMIVATNVTAVAAGESHTLFVKQDGSLWAMGYNNHGQLGDGTFNASSRPEQILAGGVTTVSTGNGYSLFLQSDGSLWAMGYNHYGQLGDGTTTDVNQPERIVTGGVTAIAAGQYHSLFVKSDGSLWAMGNNNFGQLGDGTAINASQPEQIVASGVTAAAAGFYHSLFLKNDGSLWGMGGNFQGQLGDGSTDGGTLRTNRPEQIVASGVVALAAGGGHSLFLKSDGSIWAMGDNAQGALGDGTTDGGNYSTNRPEQILSGAKPPTHIAAFSFSGTSLVLNGVNGLAGTTYYVLMGTNLAQPPNQWARVAVDVLGANGSFSISITNAVDPNAGKQYYLIESP